MKVKYIITNTVHHSEIVDHYCESVGFCVDRYINAYSASQIMSAIPCYRIE